MNPLQLVRTLQMADSLFPVGGFAYSDGLETAADAGHIADSQALARWLFQFIDTAFIPCEGLALLQCARALAQEDWPAVYAIDEELTALKPASETRASSTSIGRRLLTTCGSGAGDTELLRILHRLPQCNAPVAYAIVFTRQGIPQREALLAFGYLRLAGMVSAGMRLAAIGQQQGQGILTQALERLPTAVDRIADMKLEPLRSFNPRMDIHQMNHRYVYSRLFRS